MEAGGVSFLTDFTTWFNGVKAEFILNFVEKNRWKMLLSGLGNTLLISLLACLIGIAIGMITPPVAINLFVASGITGLSLEKISKAVVPYLIGLVIVFLAIVYLPLFIPGFIG